LNLISTREGDLSKYDWDHIERMRTIREKSWAEIAEQYGTTASNLRALYYRRKAKAKRILGEFLDRHSNVEELRPVTGLPLDPDMTVTPEIKIHSSRITSVEDMVSHLNLDLDSYRVVRHWVKSTERRDGPSFNVSVQIEPLKPTDRENVVREMWTEMIEDAKAHAPTYEEPKRIKAHADGEPCILVIAVVDPHLGMLAWGRECGAPYDLTLGIADYEAAVEHLLSTASMYNIERIKYIVGHDLFHADTLAEGGKGATTTKGTQQDIDTRLAKIYTAVRRAVVRGIDKARLVAPVDVMCVKGNHDSETMYKFGETLHAWYRNDGEVKIQYGPSKRQYYLYGDTVFMHTHGEEFRRKRDNLVSVFATECPKEMWAAANHREVLVGHNHIHMEKVYTGDPREEVWEGRATRVRSLPGLTPEDSWHYEEGYKHQRAATALVYRRSGGVAGHHEFIL
jgi:hypothetical protein